MSAPVPGSERLALSDERLAEIREHVAGIRNWSLGNLAARDLLAEVDRLYAERHVTNEALDDAVQELRARREDVTPQVTKLRALLAGQREAVDGEHYASVHHSYRVPRDLPETGGAQ